MHGFNLKRLIDVKCVECVNFTSCKIQDGFKDLSEKFNVDPRDYAKLENCLFYKKCS